LSLHNRKQNEMHPIKKDRICQRGFDFLPTLHFLFSLMISEGLSGPGREVLRAGQSAGAILLVPLPFVSAKREHKKHISFLQRWK